MTLTDSKVQRQIPIPILTSMMPMIFLQIFFPAMDSTMKTMISLVAFLDEEQTSQAQIITKMEEEECLVVDSEGVSFQDRCLITKIFLKADSVLVPSVQVDSEVLENQ